MRPLESSEYINVDVTVDIVNKVTSAEMVNFTANFFKGDFFDTELEY